MKHIIISLIALIVLTSCTKHDSSPSNIFLTSNLVGNVGVTTISITASGQQTGSNVAEGTIVFSQSVNVDVTIDLRIQDNFGGNNDLLITVPKNTVKVGWKGAIKNSSIFNGIAIIAIYNPTNRPARDY